MCVWVLRVTWPASHEIRYNEVCHERHAENWSLTVGWFIEPRRPSADHPPSLLSLLLFESADDDDAAQSQQPCTAVQRRADA